MMQRIAMITGIGFFLILMGCATAEIADGKKGWAPIYRLQIGINKGGVVENTDMEVVPHADVDAFTGATPMGANVSGKVLLPLKRNYLETGMELMHNRHTYTYNDAYHGFMGRRHVGITQFMVPVTYSIGLFRGSYPEGVFQVRVGYCAQFNLFSVTDGAGNMPGYTTRLFSNGATLGISSTPFRLSNGAKIGLFLDAYRGSRAYEDFYNRSEFEIPGTSYVKYGIVYQF